MPVREWLRHATSASAEHAPGKSQGALQDGFAARSCSAQGPPIGPRALQARADRLRGRRGALYTALTWLALLLTMMGGHLAAQTPPSGTEPAPTPAPGPLETIPSPQERLLAPVPTQFNWLQRETPSNLFLEALLNGRGPARLVVSASLAEELSDNFDQDSSREIDARTVVALSTVYHLDDGRSFISLANTTNAFYQAGSGESRIGYANLALNAGYQLPTLSFGLAENFSRGDNSVVDETTPLRGTQQKFLRNSISPQVRYDFSPLTAATLSYTHTLVIDEGPNQDPATSHSVSPGLQHQFSPNLAGRVQYIFTTSDGSGAATSGITTPTPGLTLGASGGRSHGITAETGYQLNTATSVSLRAFGTLVNRSGTSGQDSTTYGASIGARRFLFATVSVVGAVGPTVIKRQGDKTKFIPNYQLSLDGPIPLFTTPTLTLTLTTRQSVHDTVDEVDNVGLVIRQDAEARLTYTPRAFFNAVLFVIYSRNELLENVNTGTVRGGKGQIDNLSSIGVTASYALTRTLSLTGIYRHQRRDSNQSENDFAENRVTIALTGTFPIF